VNIGLILDLLDYGGMWLVERMLVPSPFSWKATLTSGWWAPLDFNFCLRGCMYHGLEKPFIMIVVLLCYGFVASYFTGTGNVSS
jgi:hypothetical protein